MANIDFYEIGMHRRRQHGCVLISVLIIAIIVTLLMMFHQEVVEYWHSVTDPYYYPPEWDRIEIPSQDYTFEDYVERQQELDDYYSDHFL